MRKFKPGFWFLVCWILLSLSTGIWQYFNAPPTGIHQGAQTDRACIAWNYYDQSMNFFKPRVMETRLNDGIAGMEFPVVNYSVALLYKIFGPHDIIYRMVVFLIVSAGVYAVFLLSGFFMQRFLSRILLVFSWYLSPIFLYYSFSFLPDTSALSFSMIATYFFIKYLFGIHEKKSIAFYFLFISLAGLIKITFLIIHITCFSILFLLRFKPTLIAINKQVTPSQLISVFIPVVPVFSWYFYAAKLTEHTGNTHFLQQINPAKNLHDAGDYMLYAYNTWSNSIYVQFGFISIIVLYIITWIGKRKENPLLATLSALCFGGAVACYFLFQFQFLYHDYYYLIFFPALFLMFLFMQQVYLEGKKIIMGILPFLFLIGFYIFPFLSLSHARYMLKERFRPDSYYFQEAFPEQKHYHNIADVINKFVPKGERIISAFDPTPNTSLYFMRRQGIRIAGDFSPKLTADIILDTKYKYLLINDEKKWNSGYADTLNLESKLIYSGGPLRLYRLNY
ncbi:MAG: hypothetical protein KG003_02565 [Bacteroidetes bacterium]|nr:hypothetical protein [Bacteroidota bacterium]